MQNIPYIEIYLLNIYWILYIPAGLEILEYGLGDPLYWPRDTFYSQRSALTSPTSGGRSVGIVRLRIKDTEFFLAFYIFRPPLWSSGQEFLATDPEARVRFPALTEKKK
jgi:hypothetical protein